jgi:hypothetical protein
MIDIRDHGGKFGGGKTVTNLKQAIKVFMQPSEPTETLNKGDIWVKTSANVNKIHFREFLSPPPLAQEGDVWIKLYDIKLKFIISKSFQIFSNKTEINVDYTKETIIGDETTNKFKVFENDVFQVYSSFGTARMYINGEWKYQDAYFYDGSTWKLLSKVDTDLFIVSDLTIKKYSPSLQLLWSYTAPYIGGMLVTIDPQGNVILAPSAYGSTGSNLPTIKLDPNGNVIWSKALPDYGPNQRIEKILALPNGGFITRRYDSLDAGNRVSKLYDADGNFIRNNTATGASYSNIIVCVDYTGRIYELNGMTFYVYDEDYTTLLFMRSVPTSTGDSEIDLTFDDYILWYDKGASPRKLYKLNFSDMSVASSGNISTSLGYLNQATAFNEDACLLHWSNKQGGSGSYTTYVVKVATTGGSNIFSVQSVHDGFQRTFVDKDNFFYVVTRNGSSFTLKKFDKNGNEVYSNTTITAGLTDFLIFHARRLTHRPYWL